MSEASAAASSPESVRVAVLGAGMSGVCAGVRLRERGIDDFVILEKADDVGGTWRENTYLDWLGDRRVPRNAIGRQREALQETAPRVRDAAGWERVPPEGKAERATAYSESLDDAAIGRKTPQPL